MSRKKPETVREQIFASYASLSMAHIALAENISSYNRKCYALRETTFKNLMSGKSQPKSLFDDERIKIAGPNVCCYCGNRESISADHLIPRLKGGSDEGYNLVPACRSCNSSKGSKDMLAWMREKGMFPPILLLRRYLKLVARYCEDNGYMDKSFPAAFPEMPFDLGLLPLSHFPPVPELRLQAKPAAE